MLGGGGERVRIVAVNEFDAFGVLGAHSGTSFTIGYSGNWTDSTTKLVYLRARDYDPKTGQFLQVDPAVDLTRQPYAYAHNDPLARTDPTGLCDGMPGTPPGRTCDANDYFWSSDAQAEMWGQVGNNFANMAYGIADTITYNPALTPFGASSWSELWRHALVPSIECYTPTNGFHTFASVWTGGALGGIAGGMGAAGAAVRSAGIAAQPETAIVDAGKFDYLFGRVASDVHNAARSAQNAQQFARVGVYDTPAGRAMLQSHRDGVVGDASNIARTFSNEFGSYQVRDSLFSGPGGFLKVEFTWQVTDNGLRLTTVIPMLGR